MPNVLGQLLVELNLSTATFKEGMSEMQHRVKEFSDNIKETMETVVEAFALREVFDSLRELMEQSISNASRLYDMAQATGVAVSALSGLEYVAKQSGVTTDLMDKALERLSKNALAFAQTGTGPAAKAFEQLKISVLDAAGHMRPMQDILLDVAEKFAGIQNAAVKPAIAMELFGKAGAGLVPLLNRGKEGITELIAEAERLGIVLDDKTAEASKKFEESMNKLKAATMGAANAITKEILPSLQTLFDNLDSGLSESQGRFKDFLWALGIMLKGFVVAFGAVQTAFDQLGIAVRTIGADIITIARGTGAAVKDVFTGNFKDIPKSFKEMANTLGQEHITFRDESLAIWKEYAEGVDRFWNAKQPEAKKPKPPPGGGDDIIPGKDRTAFIEKTIEALQLQEQKELDLSKAIGTVAAATLEEKAAAEADAVMHKLVNEAMNQKLALTDALAAKIMHAGEVAKEAISWTMAFHDAIGQDKEMRAAIDRAKEHTSALELEARQLTTVGRAQAANTAILDKDQRKIEELTTVYKALTAQYGEESKEARALFGAISALAGEREEHQRVIEKENAALLNSAMAKETERITAETKKLKSELQDLNSGDNYLNVNRALQEYIDKGGIAVGQERERLELQRKLQILQGVKAVEKSVGWDPKELDTINEEIKMLKENWDFAKDGADGYNKALIALIAKQADLQARTGGFAAGARAAFTDFMASSKAAGETVKETIGAGLKGIEDNLAQMVVNGKAHWMDLIKSMEMMLIKSAIHSLISNLLGKFLGGSDSGGIGGFLGGLLGKAMGGPVMGGQPVIVGEQGPELWVPEVAGTVVPNNALQNMGGSTTISNVFNISSPDADSFRKSKGQIMADMFQAQQQAATRSR